MAAHMEVDGESLPPLGGITSNLKRCSSAPMINLLDDNSAPTFTTSTKQSLDDTAKPITTARYVPYVCAIMYCFDSQHAGCRLRP